MKKDEFMDAMGGLDREFLKEAEHVRRKNGKGRKWIGFAGLAAAAVLLVAGSIFQIGRAYV